MKTTNYKITAELCTSVLSLHARIVISKSRKKQSGGLYTWRTWAARRNGGALLKNISASTPRARIPAEKKSRTMLRSFERGNKTKTRGNQSPGPCGKRKWRTQKTGNNHKPGFVSCDWFLNALFSNLWQDIWIIFHPRKEERGKDLDRLFFVRENAPELLRALIASFVWQCKQRVP